MYLAVVDTIIAIRRSTPNEMFHQPHTNSLRPTYGPRVRPLECPSSQSLHRRIYRKLEATLVITESMDSNIYEPSTRLWLTKRDKSLTVCNGHGVKFITVHLEYTNRIECAARAALWITRFPLVADPRTTTSSILETCTCIPLFFILKREHPPLLRSSNKIQGRVKNRPCSVSSHRIYRASIENIFVVAFDVARKTLA
ncbi:hypothetical protein V1478_009279 [Vespula squamosa]|uniref:Uncharacterized protein n=1 Tax=Vespula squamosa TaxID=30214 RepID=A0ABD2AP65_VESSQ